MGLIKSSKDHRRLVRLLEQLNWYFKSLKSKGTLTWSMICSKTDNSGFRSSKYRLLRRISDCRISYIFDSKSTCLEGKTLGSSSLLFLVDRFQCLLSSFIFKGNWDRSCSSSKQVKLWLTDSHNDVSYGRWEKIFPSQILFSTLICFLTIFDRYFSVNFKCNRRIVKQRHFILQLWRSIKCLKM